jgi:hypothetical protein
MSREKLKSIWSQFPALGALLVGFGASFGQHAQADQATIKPSPESQSPIQLDTRADEVTLRLDGDTIYISQHGSPLEKLRLGDTPEAAYLGKLLRDAGAVGQSVSVPIGSMIVASGGGSGNGQKPKQEPPKAGGATGKGK